MEWMAINSFGRTKWTANSPTDDDRSFFVEDSGTGRYRFQASTSIAQGEEVVFGNYQTCKQAKIACERKQARLVTPIATD